MGIPMRVGWRPNPGSGQVTVSSLMTSVYAVYNTDAAGSTSLNTSLFAAYNGESNANDSYGTNNGTAVGGLTYTTGKIGNAFQFNGTNARIDFGNSSFNFGSDSFSTSMWFYPNAGNVLQCLVNKGLLTASDKGFNVFIDNRYNSNQRGISFSVGGGSGNYQQFSTTNQYTIGAWNHIVCMWDSVTKTIKIYLNGVQATTTITQTGGTGLTNITDISNTSRTGQFGTYSSGLNWFNGRIDATNFWNKELSASEITELYNAGNGAQYITDSFYKPTPNDALNTNNGTAQGGLTYGVGKVGTAFQFNGTNAYVGLPNNSMNLTGDFTISFWLYHTSSGSQTLFANTFLQTTPSIYKGFSIGIDNLGATTNKLTTLIPRSSTDYLGWQYNTSLTLNEWNHIIITRVSGVDTYAWINNVLQTVTYAGPINGSNRILDPTYHTTQRVVIGASNATGTAGGFMKANSKIDALTIWNKQLTADERTQIYNSSNGKQYPF